MQNLLIIPLGGVGEFDELATRIGAPPYVVAEKEIVSFYSGLDNATLYNQIGAVIWSVRSDFELLDVDSKSVGTYRKVTKNQLKKLGLVIPFGGLGSPDEQGCSFPSAVYDKKTKKFMVYYVGISALFTFTICLASGHDPISLEKQGVVITLPPTTNSSPRIEAIYDPEEDLFKIYYAVMGSDGWYVSFMSTSRNGYDF